MVARPGVLELVERRLCDDDERSKLDGRLGLDAASSGGPK
jgi:hypothetical protein